MLLDGKPLSSTSLLDATSDTASKKMPLVSCYQPNVEIT